MNKRLLFITFSLLLLCTYSQGQEICNNNIDDDGDGLVDCADCLDCASAANCQIDTDNDGIVDSCDDDDDNDGILDADEGCIECNGNAFINGSFEQNALNGAPYGILNQSTVNGWSTTSTDNNIEIWVSGFNGFNGSPTPAQSGNFFAEINATQVAALYQRICTKPGAQISWSVWHRGRSGVDVAIVKIGNDFATASIQTTMTTGNTAWIQYSGVYTVPTNQIFTYFIFEAVSTSSGSAGAGNFVDNIEIQEIVAGVCLDTDNDGIPNAKDPDSDGDGCLDVVESGGIDTNNDGVLDGTGFDSDGKVIGGINGYNGVTGNEIDALQISTTPMNNQNVTSGNSASFTITATGDEATSYNAGTPIYSVNSNSNTGLNYQWYIGDPNNGGTSISNSGVYSGATTATLNISSITGLNGTTYYVQVTHDDNICAEAIESAMLSFDTCDAVVSGELDTDSDGVADICDEDDDNDGILDVEEGTCFSFNSVGTTLSNPQGISTTSTSNLAANTFFSGGFLFSTNSDLSYNVAISKTLTGLTIGDNYDITVKEIGSGTGIAPNVAATLKIELGAVVLYNNLLTNFGNTYGNFGDISFSGNALSDNPILKITVNKPGNAGNPDLRISSFEYVFCNPDIDNDNIVNSYDLDSDGDGCLDVVESGGIDTNNDGVLDGTGFDNNGKIVGGTGGYNGVTGNEINALQISTAPMNNQNITSGNSASFTIIATGDTATSYNAGTPIYSVNGNSNAGLNYQWYIGDPNNGGTSISNGGVYSGATTDTLNISSITGLNGTTYYVRVTHDDNVCAEVVDSAMLSFDPCDMTVSGEIDSDSDGVADVCDEDDDNDGILDVEEGTCFSFNSVGTTLSNSQGISTTSTSNLAANTFFSGGFLFITSNDLSYNAAISKTLTGLTTGDNYDITVKEIGSFAGIAPNVAATLKIELGAVVLYNNLLTHFGNTYGNFGDISFSGNALSDNPILKITVNKPPGNAGNPDIMISSFEYVFCNPDIDNDNIVNSHDLDSDGDGCLDVVESGGTDINNDGILDGTGFDNNGKVIGGINGYNGVTGNEIDALQISTTPMNNQNITSGNSASFTITATGNVATSHNAGTPIYSVNGNSNAGLNYQWYIGDPNNGGTSISNSGVYSGATTATLNISNITGLNGTTYYVLVTHDDNICAEAVDSAMLSFDPCNANVSGELDTDSDGVADICDLDDDNDGILDATECLISQANLDEIIENTPIGPHALPASWACAGNADVHDGINFHWPVTTPLPAYAGTKYIGYHSDRLTNGTLPGEKLSVPLDSSILVGEEGRLEFAAYIYDLGRTGPNSHGPGRLRIYGGSNKCDETELLAVSDVISSTTQWTKYIITLQPTLQDVDYLSIFPVGTTTTYTYVLLDDIKLFTPSFCEADHDGIKNNLDLDSDGDGCFDVVESGGIDANNDGILDGTGVDSDGLVIGGTGGYDGNNGNEYQAHRISILSPLANQTALGGTASFTINASAELATGYTVGTPLYSIAGNSNSGLQYQWYLGNPNSGSPAISNNGLYSGANTATLNISNTATLDGQEYCVVITHTDNECLIETHCATLSANPCNATVSGNTDSDSDNISDICDLDDDNDGILDTQELGDCGNIADPSFEFADNPNISSYDNFAAAYSSGSTWFNSNGTTGYITSNSSTQLTTINHLPAHEGNAYVGFHSVGLAPSEVFGNNLIAPLVNGEDYNFEFYAYQMNLSNGVLINSGRVHVFGIRTGTSPVLNTTTQTDVNTMAAIPNVDLLGISDLVDNTTAWERFTIPFTASQNYDRILIAIDGTDAFLGFDNIIFSCQIDTDKDGIVNHKDPDSDGDGCPDVVESGGVDANNDGILDGTGFDSDGKVTGGTGGYDGNNGNEYQAHQVVITNAPSDQTKNLGESTTFSVTVQADAATSYSSGIPLYGVSGNSNNNTNYQWFIGNPNTTGTPITDGGLYSGAATPTLSISDVSTLGGSLYCVRITHSNNDCIEEIRCATLSVNTTEICGDGQDNDADGLIDCADPDCSPIISDVIPTPLICPIGNINGQIEITATGPGTLSYSITNEPNYQASNTFLNLGQGLYTIRVKSSTGCSATYNTSIIQLDTPSCPEICDDGIDNDGDGAIDCDDNDCGTVSPITTINDN